MARTRYIKPGFFANEELADRPPLVRIFFAGLWCLADREGRLEDRPKRIKAAILPYDDADPDEMLDSLASGDFVERYEVEGVRIIQIKNFAKHQNPHRNEAASTLPAKESPKVGTEGAQGAPDNGKNPKPFALGMGNGERGTGNGESGMRNSSSPKLRFDDDDLALAEEIFQDILAYDCDHKPPNLQKWANCIRLMRERDGPQRSLENIRKVWKWAHADEFWSATIMSPDGLRKNWEQLWAKMNGGSHGTKKRFVRRGQVYDPNQQPNWDN